MYFGRCLAFFSPKNCISLFVYPPQSAMVIEWKYHNIFQVQSTKSSFTKYPLYHTPLLKLLGHKSICLYRIDIPPGWTLRVNTSNKIIGKSTSNGLNHGGHATPSACIQIWNGSITRVKGFWSWMGRYWKLLFVTCTCRLLSTLSCLQLLLHWVQDWSWRIFNRKWSWLLSFKACTHSG